MKIIIGWNWGSLHNSALWWDHRIGPGWGPCSRQGFKREMSRYPTRWVILIPQWGATDAGAAGGRGRREGGVLPEVAAAAAGRARRAQKGTEAALRCCLPRRPSRAAHGGSRTFAKRKRRICQSLTHSVSQSEPVFEAATRRLRENGQITPKIRRTSLPSPNALNCRGSNCNR